MAILELDREASSGRCSVVTYRWWSTFYADWRAPCRQVAAVLEQLAAKSDGRVRFVNVNVDHHPDLVEAYRVSSIRTLLLFVSHGRLQPGGQAGDRTRA
jgi:thioredoxin-like negative regulator of GroEL